MRNKHENDDILIQYGKYKNQMYKDIPADWLLYIWGVGGRNMYEGSPLKDYIRDNLKELVNEANKNKHYNKIDYEEIK